MHPPEETSSIPSVEVLAERILQDDGATGALLEAYATLEDLRHARGPWRYAFVSPQGSSEQVERHNVVAMPLVMATAFGGAAAVFSEASLQTLGATVFALSLTVSLVASVGYALWRRGEESTKPLTPFLKTLLEAPEDAKPGEVYHEVRQGYLRMAAERRREAQRKSMMASQEILMATLEEQVAGGAPSSSTFVASASHLKVLKPPTP